MFILPLEYISIPYWTAFTIIVTINLIIVTEISLAIGSWGKVPIGDPRPLAFCAVIPAYLPNEYKILEPILKHYSTIINDMETSTLHVILVYNGKIDNQANIIASLSMINIRITILENSNSGSKSENINFALDYIKGQNLLYDVISLFDADHLPDPNVFDLVSGIFSDPSVDVVQGRCAIRFSSSLLSKLIAIEFSEIYSLFHNGGYIFRKYGIFGGTNGHWRYSTISEVRFDKDMLTEDIDATMRALEWGYNIVYSNSLVSYELSPPSISALYSQRLRWAQGWAEVTWRSTVPLMRSGLTTWQKNCCTNIATI